MSDPVLEELEASIAEFEAELASVRRRIEEAENAPPLGQLKQAVAKWVKRTEKLEHELFDVTTELAELEAALRRAVP